MVMVSQFSVPVTPQIVVSAQPPLVGLLRARNRGVRSVLNLRHEDEWDLTLSPVQERAKVVEFGLQYRHFPVRLDALSHEQVERFGRELSGLPGPTMVHCDTGERAMTMVLLGLGARQGWTAERIFARAEELGRPIQADALRALVDEYLPDREEEAAEATAAAS